MWVSHFGEPAMRIKSVTVFVAVLLVAAAIPAAASAATTLDVNVEQDDATGEVLVDVTSNGTAVENATVNVTSEAGYVGNGTYQTDANGSVTLAQPEDTQNITVTATDDNLSAETTVKIVGDNDLTVDVAQADDGTVSIGVERNDTAVANATVNVSASNDSYAATGNYTTDENGTVELDAPEENVSVTVTVSEGDDTTTKTVDLVAPEASLDLSVEQTTGVEVSLERGDEAVENATVDVTSDGNYSGTGTYETDADGTVSLPAPTENVTITVTATADNDTVSETVDLTTEFVEEEKNFGQAVNSFIEALRAAGFNGPPGLVISDFATENNPGNADDAPGQEKKHSDDEANETTTDDDKRGPPEHAKNKGKKDKNNEKKAGNGSDNANDAKPDKDESEDESEDSEEEREDDDSEQGPPENANAGGGANANGNANAGGSVTVGVDANINVNSGN